MFLLLTIAIAFTSGFLVAASSIELIGTSMRDDCNTEDGHFATTFEADRDAIKDVEGFGCTVVDQFYYDAPLDFPGAAQGTQARAFVNRGEYNQAVYCEGRAPETDAEIAFDRVFCQNNDLAVGDSVNLAGRDMTVSGIMTLSDYSCLFQNNSSFIFNALSFTTAQVTQEAFDQIEENQYEEELRNEGCQNILLYGAAFREKDCMIDVLPNKKSTKYRDLRISSITWVC